MSEETGARLVQIADQMRAMASNGLTYSTNSYDIDRYQKLLILAAELLSVAATQTVDEIVRIFTTDVDLRTPLVGMDAAIFDDEGRVLLIQRSDNHKWAMPGGAAEVGETPAANIAREVWEETGYQVEITHLLGVFDNSSYHREAKRHGYLLLFAGKVTGGEITLSSESIDVQWVALDAILWDDLSPGHSKRLRHALKWFNDPTTPTYFDLLSPQDVVRDQASE